MPPRDLDRAQGLEVRGDVLDVQQDEAARPQAHGLKSSGIYSEGHVPELEEAMQKGEKSRS